MKMRRGFVVREVGGKKYAVATGDACNYFKGMLTINDMGAFIFDKLKKDVTAEEIVDAILAEYDAGREVVTADVNEFLTKLRDANILVD